MIEKLNLGVRYFEEHGEEAVEYISKELDYSAEDAREWLGTVRFGGFLGGGWGCVVRERVGVLLKGGVWGQEVEVEGMVGIRKKE